ncbi:hypothetical protein GAJ06_21485 [Escherichia coli]|nr:hypothetical protein [Escherichia coli]
MANKSSFTTKKNDIKPDPIIAILEKRAKSARVTMLVFIYLIFTAMLLVFSGVVMMKSKNDNPFKSFINMFYTPNGVDLSNFIQKTSQNNIASHLKKEEKKVDEGENQDELEQFVKRINIKSRLMDSYLSWKSPSQELAESVASIVISLTLLIFVGFVMKASIMFIKYHMQIGNDYDNQKIAYLLSKGDIDVFEKTLDCLRKHNITFEKTPNLPQEKIIDGLINALNISKKKQ